MARVMTSESVSRAGRPVLGGRQACSSFHQSSTRTYNETKKESRSTRRHHPLERVWCSIRSGLLLCWPELHISRLRSSLPLSLTPNYEHSPFGLVVRHYDRGG